MKEYIDQIYTEGLGTTFYLKPVKFFKKKIKNKRVREICIFLYSWLYTFILFVIVVLTITKGVLIY